jgi:ribosomal protein S18 acetylase RimI-like enzyme
MRLGSKEAPEARHPGREAQDRQIMTATPFETNAAKWAHRCICRIGVAYCAPEAVASGTWNLLMLWTRNDRHGRGIGSKLVAHLEAELLRRAARLLIVETSALPAFTAARSFYTKVGFSHEATIKNFFADGDDKLVFTKPVSPK